MNLRPVLAVIPARCGSKGLPGKNLRMLAGVPLIVHSIEAAKLVPEISECIVSTDSPEIARVARQNGCEAPFLRPARLAKDTTPMLPVLQHAVREMEKRNGGRPYGALALLQPTSPLRLPQDISKALQLLEGGDAEGVVSVSDPGFNPRYVCVEERGGYLADAFASSRSYTRRQELPTVYRVNGMVYVWRRDFVVETSDLWAKKARLRMLVVPRERAIDIDDRYDFDLAEASIRSGLVKLPWLERGECAARREMGAAKRG